jgi:hypothetical protein
MKKTFLVLGILAATIIAVVVLNFCTKTETGNNAHSVKVRKGLVKSKLIKLPSGQCVVLELICTSTAGTCVIDGNIYTVECGKPSNVIDQGTYHIENQGNGWTWGTDANGQPCPCFPSHLGISLTDLLGLVNDSLFPVTCCGSGGGGGGPCGPIYPIVTLPSGGCYTFDLECCKGEINGWFEEVDCTTGEPIRKGVFSAKYTGLTNNPDEFNDLNWWKWDGDQNESHLLEVLKNTYLVPCLQ